MIWCSNGGLGVCASLCSRRLERQALVAVLPKQRMELAWRGGRLKGNRSILMAAAAPRSLSAIR